MIAFRGTFFSGVVAGSIGSSHFFVVPAASLTFVCFADLLMPRRGFCFVGCCNELLYDTHSKKFDVCNFFTAIFLFKDPNCYGDFDDFFCKKFREKLKRFCKLQEILRLGSKRVIFWEKSGENRCRR